MNASSEHISLSSQRRMFRREEENLLMLEQFLADLDARYVYLSGLDATPPPKLAAEVEAVLNRFHAYMRDKASGQAGRLPDWPEAFLVEQLLSRIMPPDEARAELVRQLAALKAVDLAAHAGLSAEWDSVKGDAANAEKRVSQILVAAQRAVQWKNTQRWIIRQLGTLYASRLQAAFLFALALGLALVVADALFGPWLHSAALSGIGFAAAAGLLGASFSAMVGQGRVVELDNIEEARAATSTKMIALRLGVGTAAALILYFFFEAELIDGPLFPDLAQIGFGRVQPVGVELDAARAMVDAITASGAQLLEGMATAKGAIGAIGLDAAKLDAAQAVAVVIDGVPQNVDPALVEALSTVGGSLEKLTAAMQQFEAERGAWNLPLGSLAPNGDLSKLVVWSFAAGFVQTLVPSLLAKVASIDAK